MSKMLLLVPMKLDKFEKTPNKFNLHTKLEDKQKQGS